MVSHGRLQPPNDGWIIFLGYPINDEVANIITAQLLFLDSTDRHRDIQMYINSPGGSVYSGLGVYDTMQCLPPMSRPFA